MTRRVITFHYKLTDKTGKLLDSSEGGPMSVLEDSGQIIQGLEKVLLTLQTGEKKEIIVPYAEAYGAYDQTMVYRIPKSEFPNEEIKKGDMFQIGKGKQFQIVSVVDITAKEIVVDANHPLAGKDLTFNVEILDLRPATAEELSHGHVHGEGGHHH